MAYERFFVLVSRASGGCWHSLSGASYPPVWSASPVLSIAREADGHGELADGANPRPPITFEEPSISGRFAAPTGGGVGQILACLTQPSPARQGPVPIAQGPGGDDWWVTAPEETPRQPRAQDVAALVGVLAVLEGEVWAAELNARYEVAAIPEWAEHLARRLASDGLLRHDAGYMDLRQVLGDLNQRLRYVLGEHDEPDRTAS